MDWPHAPIHRFTDAGVYFVTAGTLYKHHFFRKADELNALRESLGDTKVLSLFGENDWISLREDQTQVADAVNEKHKGNGEFRVVPGCDHLFYKCTSMADSFGRWTKPGNEVNPVLAQTVFEWVDGIRTKASLSQ